MNGEEHHAHHNLQKAITIYDTDRQPVEDDDHTYYSEAGKLETVVETDETFDLDDSETFHSSNSQNINFNKDAITQAAIRRRRRFVTCMSVMPLLVSLIALVSLLSQNSQKEEEDVVYLNETNNNATILSNAEDTIDIVGETSTDQSTTYNSVAKTRLPSSSSPTPNPTKSPSLSPTTKNPSTSPTLSCGNGICDEDPDSCPDDCIQINFMPTDYESNAESNGQMFTIKANEEVAIQSLDFVAKKDGKSDVMVLTKDGNHVGYETNGAKNIWTLLLHDGDIMFEKDEVTAIELPTPVSIGRANDNERAFYVYSHDVPLMYHKIEAEKGGKDTPVVLSSEIVSIGDVSIEVSSVVGTKKLFQDVNGEGVHTGGITYYMSASYQENV